MNHVAAPISVSHTFGNVTAFITEYVKGLFPKDYFSTVNISSMLAYRQFSIFDNKNKSFIKKNKPMLIIRPRIDIAEDNDVFLNGTYLTHHVTDNVNSLDMGNLQPFIQDDRNKIFMKYLMNRVRMYFDVTIIVESMIEQMNQGMYLRNRVRQDRPFYLETALESNVPRQMINLIAKEAKIDVDNTSDVLNYLNSHSYYPVTYKMKNSTGNDEFFRYHPARIDTVFSSLTLDDGSKKGFINDAFAINFTINTEFTTAGIYYFFTENSDVETDFIADYVEDSGRIKPIFTIPNMFDSELPMGWNLYTSPSYKVESHENPDVLDFSGLLNKSLRSALEYHFDKGIPVNTFIKTFVMRDNTRLEESNGDFSVDYEKLEITTNVLNLTSTYRMFIYVNTKYINELIGDIFNIDEET